MKTVLLVIDPQNSFCNLLPPDQQQIVHDGELFVPGASDAMKCLGVLIDRMGKALDDIHITLESRRLLNISHPLWYRDANGNPPLPFTVMRAVGKRIIGSRTATGGRRVDIGEFVGFPPIVHRRAVEYLQALKVQNRYSHTIWPPHCVIGTVGHCVQADLMRAILGWETLVLGCANYESKGSNCFVEHFSAVQAAIPDPIDMSTEMNTSLLGMLSHTDNVLIAGVGRAGAIPNTILDICSAFKSSDFTRKCGVLTDCIAVAPDANQLLNEVVDKMRKTGLRAVKSLELAL